jgi:hypothetical protein
LEQPELLTMGKQQTNTVAACEVVLATLQDKRAKLVEKGAALDQQRRAAAFDAHAGNDPRQRKILDTVNAKSAVFANELASIDAAIAVGKGRLATARAYAAKQADRTAAMALRKSFAEFVALAEELDETLTQLVSISTAMGAKVNEIHAGGSPAPTEWASARSAPL